MGKLQACHLGTTLSTDRNESPYRRLTDNSNTIRHHPTTTPQGFLPTTFPLIRISTQTKLNKKMPSNQPRSNLSLHHCPTAQGLENDRICDLMSGKVFGIFFHNTFVCKSPILKSKWICRSVIRVSFISQELMLTKSHDMLSDYIRFKSGTRSVT